jgi:hypothetical protein
LVDKLKPELNFKQSKYGPCVLWNDGCLINVYTDDTIITGLNEAKIDETIAIVAGLCKITSEDSVDDFLGINVVRKEDGTTCLTQPKHMQSILDDSDAKTKPIPVASSIIPQQHLNSPAFNEPWHFLEQSTRPDIAYVVHQCA